MGTLALDRERVPKANLARNKYLNSGLETNGN